MVLLCWLGGAAVQGRGCICYCWLMRPVLRTAGVPANNMLSAPTSTALSGSCGCSRDALAPIGLDRYDVDRLSAALVGGLPYRFASMLQVLQAPSCGFQ